ncbi:fumarylacetoacetate hydrolase family protein [Pacificibacter sp.]|uniref:fumarylacetoacetate hydrolase family protein n=1 Tax=Pacificibacter sp. TaxID=1917866 RepID=UPI00321BEA6C
MKFVTLADGTPDGRLHIVSQDGTNAVPAQAVTTLQMALETWEQNSPTWQGQSEALNAGTAAEAQPVAIDTALSPLPRAWQWLDGSAFETHALLLQQAWGQPVVGLNERPLMYQGLSDRFLPPTAPARFPSAADGIDIEGEFGVILDAVPLGTKAKDAGKYIRLVGMINDWSLRALGPIEMATGFGWLQCKPSCAMAPFAVTPDELGHAWRDHRVCLPLQVQLNGADFGHANGSEMKFGFDELIEHAAYSRDLPAGTILGSGTVSNADYESVGSSCIAEKRAIETIQQGEAKTSFMQDGDHVLMRTALADGANVFGDIAQNVTVLESKI